MMTAFAERTRVDRWGLCHASTVVKPFVPLTQLELLTYNLLLGCHSLEHKQEPRK